MMQNRRGDVSGREGQFGGNMFVLPNSRKDAGSSLRVNADLAAMRAERSLARSIQDEVIEHVVRKVMKRLQTDKEIGSLVVMPDSTPIVLRLTDRPARV